MKKVICGKLYDTQNAKLIQKNASGIPGESDGFEETLYQTEEGLYFFYCNGGKDSPYPKEDIKRVSKANAEKWLQETAQNSD